MATKLMRPVSLEIEECCQCGVPFAMTEYFRSKRIEDGETFYCPAGHPQVYSEPTIKKLREAEKALAEQKKLLDNARVRMQLAEAQVANERDWRTEAERSLSATKGVVTRMKRRVGNGVCPCCGRTFQQLARHMAAKHPGFAEEGR